MDTHVKVLAVLYIIFGALGTLAGLGLMALPVLGITGAALGAFLLMLSLPGVIAGFGLLKYRPWARILTIVLSALNLMNFPIGTALGVYGLWVMLSDDGSRLFAQPPVST